MNKNIQRLHIDTNRIPRKGCMDMWNAFMVKGAIFTHPSDIPICPCTTTKRPSDLISYAEAKAMYKKEMNAGNQDFHHDAFIHFYIDDQFFDGKRNSIWLYPEDALKVIKHFAGIITPDFSTYADFPHFIKGFNTYRMRAFGYWITGFDIPVINNVRWGTRETWDYCFDGIPKHSIVAIGTVASDLKHKANHPNFEAGLRKMVETIQPCIIIVYGSANYPFFDNLIKQGIEIISFPSRASESYSRREKK